MSLLLDALKKAEKAKEEAQRRASGALADARGDSGLRLEEPAAAAPHVVMRSELPSISAGLEILSGDLDARADTPAQGAAQKPMAAPEPGTARRAASRPAAAATDPSVQRAAARKVFEAKFKESNPRMPFYIAMGVLGVLALGTAWYFWYQLRPPTPLVRSNPAPAAEQTTLASAPPAPGAGNVAAGGVITAAASAPVIAGLPTPAGASASAPPPPPAPASPGARGGPVAAEDPATDAAARTTIRRSSQASPPPQRGAGRSEAQAVAASRRFIQVHPKVDSAYAAYLAGDLGTARADYEQALREDPANRDALLGLAAADVRTGRFEAAEATYVRLLQIDPRDAHAQAALIALRSGRVDPVAAESRVKSLLAADPGAHVLYFTLGNQLAQQERWAEAQQQYFKAFAAEPDNADFAYNLAVSLDHLRQGKVALEYYQRALALAAKRGASFDLAAARQRIELLGR